MKTLAILLLPIFLLSFAANAQTGGGYDLSHNVIASGGGTATGDNYVLSGTIGQPTAGTNSTGGQFSLRGGFWTLDVFAPTSASVSLSGRIQLPRGNSMGRIKIKLQNLSTGVIRSASPNPFGYYRFDELEVGFYLIRAESRNYQFDPPEFTFNLIDNMTGVDFAGQRAF